MRLIILFILATSLFFISCKKGSTTSTENFYVAFKATLNGTSETPPNASTASGLSSVTYNKSTKLLSINVTYSGLTVTGAHIHKGAVATAGAIIFSFTKFTSPINANFTLDALQEADLLANLYYVDLHSAAFPNGEIRGQLIRQ